MSEITDRVEGKPTTTIAAEDAALENLPELIAAARKRVHDTGADRESHDDLARKSVPAKAQVCISMQTEIVAPRASWRKIF